MLFSNDVLASLAFIMYRREKLGLLQLRRGPNVVDPFGILKVLCLLKHVFKEIIVPTQSDKVVFFGAAYKFCLGAYCVGLVPFNEGG